MSTPTTKTIIPGWAWPVIIVGLLGLNVAVCAITVVSALSGDTSIEPDYYKKALAWDAHKAEFPDPESLGWTVEAAADDGTLRVSITDRADGPVPATAVTGVYFHQAHSDARTKVVFTGVGDGRFIAPADLARPGLWELRLEIRAPRVKAQTVRQINIRPGG